MQCSTVSTSQGISRSHRSRASAKSNVTRCMLKPCGIRKGSYTLHAGSYAQQWHSVVPAAATASGGGGGAGAGGSSGGGGRSGGAGGAGGSSHPMQPWTYLLAVLLAAGGIMGWVKGKSPKSLGGGLSSALILGLAARSMAGATPLAGARVAFAVTFMLGIFFVSRFARTKKVFPAGVGAGVSLLYAAAYVATGL